VRFLNDRAGGTIPSPALLEKIGRAYVEEINRFVKANDIPVVRFAKGDVKGRGRPQAHAQGRARRPQRGGDARYSAGEGVGVARLAGRRPGRASALRVRPPGDLHHHHSFYILVPDWGPSFIKGQCVPPYPVRGYLSVSADTSTPSARHRDEEARPSPSASSSLG
jgi:hypothetical protein